MLEGSKTPGEPGHARDIWDRNEITEKKRFTVREGTNTRRPNPHPLVENRRQRVWLSAQPESPSGRGRSRESCQPVAKDRMALTSQLGNDSTNVTLADPIENLPPLPTPDYATQNLERVRGTTLVLSLITIFVACTTALVQGQFLTEPVLCLHDLTHAFPLARFFQLPHSSRGTRGYAAA